ncbi:MAG: heliorhodopsin HeR [Candidatus Heimdallarchaeota archaeon]
MSEFTFTSGETSSISMSYLKKFNIAMAILHLIQSVLVFGLSLIIDEIKNFSVDIYISKLVIKELTGTKPIFGPEPEVFFAFENVAGILLASFLFMSAVAHFLIAYPLNNSYVENLKNKMNPVRWWEYAFSSSVMIIFISLAFGILDFWVIALIFVLNFLMNMFGLLMEKYNQYTAQTSWLPYWLGWIAGIMPWIVILGTFLSFDLGVDQAIPTFIYVAVVMYFIFFNSFALNMFLQYKRIGPWKDYLYGERGYQLLSLVAKSALAWLVFMGLIFA